ncbi:MAG: GxxExxY protein, partial [Anaerolineales bacterium]|nr:GxxExxY protein [Anaerolineales bacterium]
TPYDALRYKIIGLAMAIHNELGPGFPEEIYHRAMIVGLTVDGVPHVAEFEIEISFRGQTIGKFELDLVADQKVIVELKAVSALAPIHEQQVIAYLAASGLPVGLLINFGAAKLEFKRLFPPKAVQSSIAYQARRSKSQSA